MEVFFKIDTNPLSDDPSLLERTRYIHGNPLRAGMVQNMGELNEYPWTGHSAMMGTLKRGWQDTEPPRASFGKGRKGAREQYEEFLTEGIPDDRRPQLVGGGLVRSLGGHRSFP